MYVATLSYTRSAGENLESLISRHSGSRSPFFRKAATARSHDRLLVRLGFELVLDHGQDEPATHHPAKED